MIWNFPPCSSKSTHVPLSSVSVLLMMPLVTLMERQAVTFEGTDMLTVFLSCGPSEFTPSHNGRLENNKEGAAMCDRTNKFVLNNPVWEPSLEEYKLHNEIYMKLKKAPQTIYNNRGWSHSAEGRSHNGCKRCAHWEESLRSIYSVTHPMRVDPNTGKTVQLRALLSVLGGGTNKASAMLCGYVAFSLDCINLPTRLSCSSVLSIA